MPVNWNWKHRKGIITFIDELEPKKKYKCNIYCANCLGAIIYEWYDKEKKEMMYQFMGFWSNEKHLKNLLGLTKEYKDNSYYKTRVKKIRLNTFYKDNIQIAKLFAKAHIPVELFYFEKKD